MGNGRLSSPRHVKGNEIVFTDPLHDEKPARAAILAHHLMWGLGQHGKGLTRLQFVLPGNVQRFNHHQPPRQVKVSVTAVCECQGTSWPLPKVRIYTRTSGVSTIHCRSSMT